MEKGNGKRKLNILQVHDYYRFPGGEDQVVHNEGKMLREHGHRVYLYSRRNKELDGMKWREKIRVPFAAFFSWKTFWEVRRLIREKDIDLVHVHNTVPLISPSVFYAAFWEHVPVVMTVHNFRLLCPDGLFYRKGRVCEECVEKGLWCSVKHGCYRESRVQTLVCALSIGIHRMLRTYQKVYFICLTEFQKKKILQLKQVDAKKVFIKPNFVDTAKQSAEVLQRKNYVLYAGRLEESKGIKVLLRAYKELAKGNYGEEVPELIICGDGSLKKQCERYVKKNYLDKISFAGWLPNEAVKKMMAEAKAIVIPSLYYEGFPVIIAEACSVKTPVIGSDLGNVGELITDQVNGWKFEAGNAKALANAILSCNKKSCSFEVPEAKAWSDEGNYDKLMEIYERCMKDVR